ncbi:hypothetical protein PYW07_006627 [Mythimna separata]|uniref:Regulatory protein zeste n=1 Tax=Mythimna separata TaxID=271217 RepID=A0AAD8DXN6_MYTSE|nr:hypothetical protein PYW07_006627 [Mythimna separata]
MKSEFTRTPNDIVLLCQQYKMANRVSNEQLEELLDYLAEHTTLVKGVGLGSRSKESIDRQWNDLARKLNAFGSGSSKTGDRWKKYWADLKHKSKSRLAKRRQDALGTGGGPSTQEDLSEVDKKVLAIIGDQAVYGDSQHRVPVFNIQSEEPVLPTGRPDDMVVSEVVITDTFDPLHVASSVEGQMETSSQEPEPHQIAVESPVSQPARSRSRRSRNRPSLSSNTAARSRIDPEWVMELERSRVQVENKLAEANLKMAEAAVMTAEANLKIAEASRINAETSRQQVEIMREFSSVVAQLSSALAAKNSH